FASQVIAPPQAIAAHLRLATDPPPSGFFLRSMQAKLSLWLAKRKPPPHQSTSLARRERESPAFAQVSATRGCSSMRCRARPWPGCGHALDARFMEGTCHVVRGQRGRARTALWSHAKGARRLGRGL